MKDESFFVPLEIINYIEQKWEEGDDKTPLRMQKLQIEMLSQLESKKQSQIINEGMS